MEGFQKGDVVGRKSYNTDIYFKIKDFYKDDAGRECASLRGLYTRLCASAPLDDLVKIEPSKQMACLREMTIKTNERVNRIFARRQRERELFFGRAVLGNNDIPKTMVKWQVLICRVLCCILTVTRITWIYA